METAEACRPGIPAFSLWLKFTLSACLAGSRRAGMTVGEEAARDHLSFNVERPAKARTKAMIQKRMTIVASDQPICSKW